VKDILEKARDLGRAIAKSERLGAVKTLRKEADGDEALQADLRALNELSEKIAKLEKDVKPVEPEDKHRLRELQQKVTGNPTLQKLARAEADFAELMNRVNKTIRAQFGAESDADE